MALHGIIGVLVLFSTYALAIVNEYNAFQYPGYAGPSDIGTQAWPIGSSRPLRWYSDISSYDVTLWQNAGPILIGRIWNTSDTSSTSQNITFNWVVNPLGANLTLSSVFFLWGGFEIDRTSTSGFTSFAFTMSGSEADLPATTSSSASSMSTTSGASTSSASSAGTSTTSDSPSSTSGAGSSSNSNSGDNSVPVGVGVGVGVGLALLIIIGAWLIWRRKRGAKQRNGNLDKDAAAGGAYEIQTEDHRTARGELEAPWHSDAPRGSAKAGGEVLKSPSDLSSPQAPAELSADRPMNEMG